MEKMIRRIQNGESNLLEDLLFKCRDYINEFIKVYDGKIRDYDDLKQECYTEFVKAVYGYEFKYGFLKSYLKIILYTCVQRYLVKHIDDFIDKNERYAFCVRLFELCKRRLGYEPNIDDFKRIMMFNESDTIKVFKIINNPEIDNVCYDDEYNVGEYNEDIMIQNIDNSINCDLIENTTLSKRQKELLYYHYGFKSDEVYSFSDMSRMLDSHRQVYSDANISLIKRIKKKLVNKKR